jgi:aryl-alcohol dehydrogenase-like predicted oxidoreductase
MRSGQKGETNALAIIREAISLGVNFLDTAENYHTEGLVGKAIAGIPRDRLVISTKKTLPSSADPDLEKEFRRGLEQSLKSLGTDYIDIYHLHGVEPADYQFSKTKLMPIMRRLREEGKIRFIGVTEGFVPDPAHKMLEEGLNENLWDVVMVGFNVLNVSARRRVLPLTRENGVGVLNMFAVRRALSQPQQLKQICAELVRNGLISRGEINPDDPFDFVLRDSDAATLPEAAYRFCRHEPGVQVVLTGTGNIQHLKENIQAIVKPALPPAVLQRLDRLFGKLDHLTGN